MSHTRFRLTISLMAVISLVPGAFGQNPSSAGSGDTFNTATTDNSCRQTFDATKSRINADLQEKVRGLVLRNALCKYDKDCVKKVQQERQAADEDARRKVRVAEDIKNACESKPLSSRSQRPAQGKAIAPRLDPSADKPPLLPLRVRIAKQEPRYDPPTKKIPQSNPTGNAQTNQGRPLPKNRPGHPDIESIRDPKLSSGVQSTQGQLPARNYTGPVPPFGAITLHIVSPPDATRAYQIAPDNNALVKAKTVWGYEASGKFWITKVKDLEGHVVPFQRPVALPKSH